MHIIPLIVFLIFLHSIAAFTAEAGKNSMANTNLMVKKQINSNMKIEMPIIIAFGNSLTAGYGVHSEKSFPSLLENKLLKLGYKYKVINAGISGDTTEGGVRRVKSISEQNPEIVILELGVNDGLKGFPVNIIEENLEKIILFLLSKKIEVVLAGMKIPPDYGEIYTKHFRYLFRNLAQKHNIHLIDFFLEGVAGDPGLNQFDGIHPTEEGYEIISDTVLHKITGGLLKK